jgi:hypothetical protein
MPENKKKIKKKELLLRIEALETKLQIMQNEAMSQQRQVQLPVIPDTLLTRPVTKCNQCGAEAGGVCMSVNCPNGVKITC